VGGVLASHMCNSGQAFTQYIVPAVCVMLLTALADTTNPRLRCLLWGIGLLMVLLVMDYNWRVHGGRVSEAIGKLEYRPYPSGK
jgi:hypothetical protein